MKIRNDLTGHKFHKLTVLGFISKDKHGQLLWECLCECGNKKIVSGSNLRGKTHSCGCIHKSNAKTVLKTHGASGTKTHRIWKGMISRCYTPSASGFKNYGARGILVCDRWRTSYENFLADMGECHEGYSIERRNNNDNYTPENCYWSARSEQNRNRRNNRVVTLNGVTRCIAEWADIIGIKDSTIRRRISRGWDAAMAVTTPVQKSAK